MWQFEPLLLCVSVCVLHERMLIEVVKLIACILLLNHVFCCVATRGSATVLRCQAHSAMVLLLFSWIDERRIV